MVFVNHYANTATALVFKAADYTAMAVDLHITAGTHDIARKQDRKIHYRTHWYVSIHCKQDTIGRDVLGFHHAVTALRFQLYGQMQRKTWSALHFRIVLGRRFLLRVRRQLLL